MNRKVSLSKGAQLWSEGDSAGTIAVLESGRLGVQSEGKLIGLIQPKTVLGESALLTLDSGPQTRTAGVMALEDDSQVVEYPAAVFRQVFDQGNHGLGHMVLLTLVGQTCRNYLLITAAHREHLAVSAFLQAEVKALGQLAGEIKKIAQWQEFGFTFRFLLSARDHSDAERARLVQHLGGDSEALAKASEMIREILKGHDVVSYFDEFIQAEREKDKWFVGQDKMHEDAEMQHKGASQKPAK